uniref:Uncharacterized protein n=1 Tax=Anguilla anguilla TaxID=7936 RepID=A0A0E9P7A4_ANGAN
MYTCIASNLLFQVGTFPLLLIIALFTKNRALYVEKSK